MRLRVIGTLLGAALSTVSCQRVSVAEGDPTALIDGFRSFQSEQAVGEVLKQRGLSFVELERSSRPAPARAPRFEKLVWQVRGYEHLGHRGDLLLQFHNDRLMETVFYPQDVSVYLGALKKAGYRVPDLIPTSPGSPAAVIPPGTEATSTEVLAVTDIRGRQYIMWGDRRIRNEYIAWINAFA